MGASNLYSNSMVWNGTLVAPSMLIRCLFWIRARAITGTPSMLNVVKRSGTDKLILAKDSKVKGA